VGLKPLTKVALPFRVLGMLKVSALTNAFPYPVEFFITGYQHKNPNLNCFPLTWPTMTEHLQNAGVTWQIFQNPTDDYVDILTDFAVFRDAKPGSPFYDRGMLRNANNSLDTFYKLAQEGNLPQVRWIIGDQELCEHPPWRPQDGGWLQKQIVEAIISGQSYKDTVLMIIYDGMCLAFPLARSTLYWDL
jgi:phospholipase C